MTNAASSLALDAIAGRILVIRGPWVMPDSDLGGIMQPLHDLKTSPGNDKRRTDF
ncbi:hypothetical protein LJC46_02385 [Desulfovibrio sp. OttesenSCG-928-G15]|nr:hypothetical protein [Desulfovibrio sp. OttesenSCG-928-G15]